VGVYDTGIAGISGSNCPPIRFNCPHHILGVVLGWHRFTIVSIVRCREDELTPSRCLTPEMLGEG
jgi:hypothetical protein